MTIHLVDGTTVTVQETKLRQDFPRVGVLHLTNSTDGTPVAVVAEHITHVTGHTLVA